MQTFVKSLVLGLGLVSAIAISAQAQTTPVAPGASIANLPPNAAPSAPADLGTQAVAPSAGVVGPDPGKGWYAKEQQTQAVTPSAGWEGPDPGKGWYSKEQPTQAVAPSPDWQGPKPN